MKLRWVVLALAASAVVPAVVRAGEVSSLGLLSPQVAVAVDAVPQAAPVAVAFATAPQGGDGAQLAAVRVLESVRWRPRRWRDDGDDWARRSRSSRSTTGITQIHAGFYDPDGEPSAGFLAGFRGAAGVDDHIQLGLGLDWVHKGERTTVLVNEVPLPGGGTSTRRLELSRSSQNLFPIMAFIQLVPGDAGGVIPYFGIGGGYEVLFLSAEDFQTQQQFDATYHGWGWQAWGGVAIPLSNRTRLNAEVFRNTADVGRDVDDTLTGQTYREIVDVNGTGMRFGFSWGF